MGAFRDNEVKQLFLNAKPRRLEFGGRVSSYDKLAEVPGVARGILKIELKKIYFKFI